MDALGQAILKTVDYLNTKGSPSKESDIVSQIAAATQLEKKALKPFIKDALMAGHKYGYLKQYNYDYYSLDEKDIQALLGDPGKSDAMEIEMEWVPHKLTERTFNSPAIEDGAVNGSKAMYLVVDAMCPVEDCACAVPVVEGVFQVGETMRTVAEDVRAVDEATCPSEECACAVPVLEGVFPVGGAMCTVPERVCESGEDICPVVKGTNPAADSMCIVADTVEDPQLQLDQKFIEDMRNLVRKTCGACRKRKGKRGRSGKRRGRRGGRRSRRGRR